LPSGRGLSDWLSELGAGVAERLIGGLLAEKTRLASADGTLLVLASTGIAAYGKAIAVPAISMTGITKF